MEKSITGHNGNNNGGWNFIASPITAAIAPSANNGLASGNYDLYYYHEPTHYWRNYKENEDTQHPNADPNFNLANGQGYLYANEATTILSFTGELQAGSNGTYTVNNLSHSATELTGFNLVGNPFACNTTIDKPCYTLSGNVISPTAHESGYVIPPCTGVMVKADEEHDNVIFTKVIPTTQSTQPNAGSLQIALSQVPEPVEGPARDGNGEMGGVSTGSTTLALDNAIVSFTEGNALEKFVFNEDNAKLYIPQDGKDYAIVISEGQGELPLNFKANADGQYTISVNPENVEMGYLHLIDNMTGADIDLLSAGDRGSSPAMTTEGVSYTFNAKTTDYESRFKLVFSTNTEDGPSTGSGAFAFVSDGNIVVNGEGILQVIDMMGRVVVCTDVARNVSTQGMRPGVYVLRLVNGEKVKVQKIVIE